jgi:alpha-mannosidase II
MISGRLVLFRAARLFDQFKRVSSMYDSPVVLMVLGDDFRFNSESEWSQHFDNFIPLFKYMNEKYAANLEIGFGTYSDYFRELDKWYDGKKIKPKTLSGDFFPYNDWGSDYWTGYFTTRPFFKRRGRKLHVRHFGFFTSLYVGALLRV